ncbi:MAG TPA: ABC transporter permease [Bacteroidales bacterium]|nr:ABC transporter permease [Bacteroidales bacterium]
MNITFALRNLFKRPFLNLVKIAGLALALTGIILILLYIRNELSFDRYHRQSDRIYRFTVTNPGIFEGKHFARIFTADYIPAMASYFPGIENYARLVPVRGGVLKHNDRFIRVNEAFLCDSTFFDVFDVKLLSGNVGKILDDPASLVISETFATKVFGKSNPVGQTLTLPSGQFYGKNVDFTVKAVMQDFPQNSHLHPEFIATPGDKGEFNGWAWTYLLLRPGTEPSDIVNGFPKFYKMQLGKPDTMLGHLQPIADIHLHSDKLREIEPNGNIFVIITLAAAALILLFISLTNYVNLNLGMAVYSDRFLQIGKVFGSSGFNRIKYYLVEGLIIIGLSVCLGSILCFFARVLLLKYFALNLFKGSVGVVIVITVLFALLCVCMSMLILLKHEFNRIQSGSTFSKKSNGYRKGISKSLIVVQYAISTTLIVSVIVMSRQTRFALKESMGNDAGNMICMEDVHSNVQAKFGIFKQELLKYNSVRSVTAMLDPPGGEANDMFAFEMEDYRKSDKETDANRIGILPCDYSFASAFNLDFLAGDDFSPTNTDNEGSGEYMINKSAVKRLGYSDPQEVIGKSFKLLFEDESMKLPAGKIIGVVEDFHVSGIRKKVEPIVMFKRSDYWLINFIISFEPGMENKGLSDLERVWKKMFPEHPFEYRPVSAIYHHVYMQELLQARLLSLFTIMALFISCMGLLGLSLLSAQRRTKEIGIRVINGATVAQILIMLNWYFIKWILISFVIAMPLAWYGMHKWLEGFAYKKSLDSWIFIVAGAVTIIIALATVSLQSRKAARRNPVEALRYE